MSLFVFWLLYMRSTFPGTEFDFQLKLTRHPKNNPPQERGERENRVMKEKDKELIELNRRQEEEKGTLTERARYYKDVQTLFCV